MKIIDKKYTYSDLDLLMSFNFFKVIELCKESNFYSKVQVCMSYFLNVDFELYLITSGKHFDWIELCFVKLI